MLTTLIETLFTCKGENQIHLDCHIKTTVVSWEPSILSNRKMDNHRTLHILYIMYTLLIVKKRLPFSEVSFFAFLYSGVIHQCRVCEACSYELCGLRHILGVIVDIESTNIRTTTFICTSVVQFKQIKAILYLLECYVNIVGAFFFIFLFQSH